MRIEGGAGILVDLGDDGCSVYLTIKGETARSLTPGEARAMAALLVHYADEAER